MIELKENDLVKIETKEDGGIILSIVIKANNNDNNDNNDKYRYYTNNFFGFNDNFMDDSHSIEVVAVWRYNEETGNFLKIYDKEELCPSVKPADISWDEHNKVLQENAELREVIVNQAKEINSLKKES